MIFFLRKTFLFCLSISVVIFCSSYTKIIIFPTEEFEMLKSALPATDVILFGSSVNRSFAEEDTDKRSISEMLDSLLTIKVEGISHGAYHSEIYLEFINYISKIEKSKPFVIIPINLRYFSPEWDLRPNYQFVKERYEISGFPYLYDFKNYNGISTKEFNSYPIFFHDKYIGNIGEITSQYGKQDKNIAARNGFIFHYMQKIDSSHRKLIALNKIAKACEKSGVRLIMYITPIDIRSAENLNIEGFRQKIIENLYVIKSSLEKEGVTILDLSFYLDSEYFDYKLIPNEHLNMHGREAVAERIKEKILTFQK